MGKSKDLATGETRFVNTSGDTMTGDLTISSTAGQLKLTDTDGTEQNTTIKQSGGNVFIQARDNTNNAGIVFAGNGGGNYNEHMRINASGIVTKPNQPAFDVAQPLQSSGDHTFGQIHLNRGSHYNSSNGRFTAPVAGVYIFFWGGIKGGNSTTTARLYVKKNGSRLYSQRHLRLDGSTNQYGENGSLQWIANLAVNDYIQAETGDGNSYTSTGEYNVFSGYLIG